MFIYIIFFLQIIIFIFLLLLFKNKKYINPEFLTKEEMSLYRESQEEFLKELHNITESSVSQIEEKLQELKKILSLVEKETQKLSILSKPISSQSETKIEGKNSRIYELQDKGWSISEIAKEVGLSKGEVELILNLRKSR